MRLCEIGSTMHHGRGTPQSLQSTLGNGPLHGCCVRWSRNGRNYLQNHRAAGVVLKRRHESVTARIFRNSSESYPVKGCLNAGEEKGQEEGR
jgi:hypothetical protein